MNSMSRRQFLATSTAGAVAASNISLLLADSAANPDRKIRFGLIGCGWYGMVDVEAAFKVGGVEVQSICDVDADHLAQTAGKIEKLQGRRPQTFKRYEDLLQAGGIDAVILATPPHWHALPFIAALERGLDIYCEKPLAYDVREASAMVAAARRHARIVQVGFQRRQSPAFKAVREYIQAGKLGRVVCVEANIHYTAGTADAKPQPPPAALDWDLWCGPAPKIPYSPQVGHFNWRLEKTTGHGHLVDWGIHLVDATRFILGVGAPRSVTAAGGLFALKDKITTPDVLTAQFDFEMCPLTWRHRIWGAEEFTPETSNGIFFYGDKGTVFVTDDRWILIPRGKNKEREVHEAQADTGKLHMADFLEAVRTRRPASCSIEEGCATTTAVKLAMIAYETGSRVNWDSARETIPGNRAAARLLKRDYRAPWKHPHHG